MKHFINQDLLAPNALIVPVDAAVIRDSLLQFTEQIDPQRFASVSPPWDSDIRWISARTLEAFATFQDLFDRLGIAAVVRPYLDLEHAVRLYSGFLVERSVCKKPNFHLDWRNTNNEAFTLLTPITDNSAGFGLIYKKLDGTLGEYEYRIGEALIMGDHFMHSTRPGRSESPVLLLSFTFGSDRMEHWDRIAETAASQGPLVQLPDGSFLFQGEEMSAEGAISAAGSRT